MNLKYSWIVLKKELKDILRDRKTIITSILVPMILIPVLNLLVGGGVEKLQKDITQNVTIALTQRSDTPEIKKLLTDDIFKGRDNIRLVGAEDPVEAVRTEQARVVLDFEEDYKERLKSMKPFVIKIMYDQSKTKSEGSVGIVSSAIEDFNRRLVAQRLEELGLDQSILQPASIQRENVADEKAGGNMMLMMLLPLMVGILIAVGGIPAATDLVAGEKERNTFEPLLTTKPGRMSILLGKYFAVTLFSFTSVAAITAGLAVTYLLNPEFINMGVEQQATGFYIPPPALILAALICITLGMTFSGLQIALSTFAKSFKEAQTYLSFLIFIAMIPGYATMFMQPDDIQFYMFLVPVLNTIAAFKMVLGGIINYTNLVIALGTSLLYVVISLLIAANLFNRERVLFRS